MKVVIIFILLGINSCSYKSFVTNMASPMIDGGIAAIFQEIDVQFAKESLVAQLKLLEGFIINSPENEEYLSYASMGFAAYSMGFVEDYDTDRAKLFYLRAKKYGLRSLRIRSSDFKKAESKSFESFEESLSSFDIDDVPSLFWTAISWGLYINLSMDDVQSLSELSKVELMMKRVQKLDPSYFGGGADLFFGVIECVKPKMLGGKPEKGLQHFKVALEISNHDFLLTKAFMAQYYCTATLNEDLFDQWADEILKADPPKDKNNNLAYALAKKKIEILMKKKDDLF